MVIVSGYYGYHNSGDEAVLAALCQDLEQLGVKRKEITVLSADPHQTVNSHGVNALHRYNLPAIIRMMQRNHLLISGGGSLLQDSTSWRTIPYYLGIIHLALLKGMRVVVYSQGIGPVQRRFYQHWIVKVLNRTHGITVRDQQSEDCLRAWGLKQPVHTTVDPVFNMDLEVVNQIEGIALNIRPYQGWEKDVQGWITLVKEWVENLQLPVTFIPLGPGDVQIGKQLTNAVPQMRLLVGKDWLESARLVAQHSICVSMRLHGLIFAAIGNSIPIGLAYDPKISAIGSQMQIHIYPTSPRSELTMEIKRIRQDQQAYRQRLAERIILLRAKSCINRQVIASVLSCSLGGK